MENNIFLVGKRVQGHHLIVTKGMLSNEQLAVMNRKGWILSHVREQQKNFQYDFVKPGRRHRQIIGW